MIRALLQTLAGGAASLLAALRAGMRFPLDPVVRLVRLSGLRAAIRGEIPVTTQFDGPVHASRGTRLSLGGVCRLGRGVFFETEGPGSIRVGAHVRINAGCVVVSHAGITIGNDCLIGEYVSIRDADHGLAAGLVMRSQAHRSAPIRIGDNVWIGRGSVILRGLTIGSGAVIGANSVVTRDVPPMAIVAGAPARLIRMRDGAPAVLAHEPAHG